MIFTLIIFLLVVVFMAFFIGKNLTNVCTLWLIKTYTNLPVAVLVLIAFGAGIIFSILLMLISKLKKSMTTTEVVTEPKKEKSVKREKTEKKIKKLKNKKPTNVTVSSSDETIVADKPL